MFSGSTQYMDISNVDITAEIITNAESIIKWQVLSDIDTAHSLWLRPLLIHVEQNINIERLIFNYYSTHPHWI